MAYEIPKITGYCIVNKNTGLFSVGGWNVKVDLFKKKPKIWSNIGHVKNHLHMFVYINYAHKDIPGTIRINPVYHDCVVLDLSIGKEIAVVDDLLMNIAKNKQAEKYHQDYKIEWMK